MRAFSNDSINILMFPLSRVHLQCVINTFPHHSMIEKGISVNEACLMEGYWVLGCSSVVDFPVPLPPQPLKKRKTNMAGVYVYLMCFSASNFIGGFLHFLS